MNEKVVVLICEIILGSAVFAAFVIILLAAWYDLRAAGAKKQLQLVSSKLHKPRQPYVTIVVYARNNQSSIQSCLESILQNRYSNYRLIVADHGSTDQTRSLVKKYRQHHKKHLVTLYSAKATTRRAEVIQRAIKKMPAGEYVLLLDGTVTLTNNTLRDSMALLTTNQSIANLTMRELSTTDVTIQSLAAHFFTLTKNILYKALSIIHLLPRPQSQLIALTKQVQSNRPVTAYASSIHYQQHRVGVPRSSLRQLILYTILWLIILTLMTYWMTTAAILKSNILLTLSWVTLCLWLLAVVWSDDSTRIGKKINLTLSIPFMYFILYIQMISDFFIKIWRLIRSIPFRNLHYAIRAELYSTRY